jgi:hypothetical protein
LIGYEDNSQAKKYIRQCQPERESLFKVPYNEDPKLAFVINSILAVVHGLDKMHKQVFVIKNLLLFFIEIQKKIDL